MNRTIILLVTILLLGCGGVTTTESSVGSSEAGVDASNVCGPLADSGLTFAQCIAASCCAQLTDCVQDRDGTPYENCIANCTFDGSVVAPEGGTCTDTCGSAHPQGAASCRPYLDCVVQDCAPRRK